MKIHGTFIAEGHPGAGSGVGGDARFYSLDIGKLFYAAGVCGVKKVSICWIRVDCTRLVNCMRAP